MGLAQGDIAIHQDMQFDGIVVANAARAETVRIADAINRACQLVEELGAGEVVGGIVDVYPVKREPSRVKLEPDKINALAGKLGRIEGVTAKAVYSNVITAH